MNKHKDDGREDGLKVKRAKSGSHASGERRETSEHDSLDPFEINFLPEFMEGRGPREPFVNEFGVTIGDHMYESPQSPLSQWTEDTDPMVMTGDRWVHPFKDIGFHTAENRDYFEKGMVSSLQGERFMHPEQNTASAVDPSEQADENGERPGQGE